MIKYYILFIILNVIDLVGSYFLLDPYIEYNPICGYLWQHYGFGTVVIVKTLSTVFPIFAIHYYARLHPKRAKFVIQGGVVLVTIPVVILGYIWSMVV